MRGLCYLSDERNEEWRLRSEDAPEVFAGELDALSMAVDDVVEFDPFGVGFVAAHAEANRGLWFE